MIFLFLHIGFRKHHHRQSLYNCLRITIFHPHSSHHFYVLTMNIFLRIVLFVVGGIVLALGGLIGYVKFALPNVGPAPELVVERTPDRIARG